MTLRSFAIATLLLFPCLASSAPLAADDGLGRLFYSPQERTMMNAQRNRDAGMLTGGEKLSVDGLVVRSSGKSTVWLNGVPSHENRPPADIAITRRQGPGGKVQLRLPASGRDVELQVGQTLDATSGKVRDAYDSPSKPAE
jgi:hypothetical protein